MSPAAAKANIAALERMLETVEAAAWDARENIRGNDLRLLELSIDRQALRAAIVALRATESVHPFNTNVEVSK